MADSDLPEGPCQNHSTPTASPVKVSGSAASSPLKFIPCTPHELDIHAERSVEDYKNELRNGDVLVLIDGKGHFVHHDKLVATNSTKFTSKNGGLFNYKVQEKLRMCKGYSQQLPRGCAYILDLTPPTDGDTAAHLLSTLSCSLGLRNWYLYAQKANIRETLVGGYDEFETPGFLLNAAAPASGSASPSPVKTSPYPYSSIGLTDEERLKNDLEIALERSMRDFRLFQLRIGQCHGEASLKPLLKRDIMDYNIVRHKTGIVNLLKLVEGNDCRLDSAPKLWTLFGIAEFFDCKPPQVIDKIVSWIIAEPNHLFLEILPEASLRIGLGLKNEMIAKLAFSVLVSEHALMIAKRSANANQVARAAKVSTFLRLKENLDDNMLSMVENAGDAFQDRISAEYETFVDSPMAWIENLPEFQKLLSFETMDTTKPVITALKKGLRTFVRSGIMACLFFALDDAQNKSANRHRWTEQYTQEWRDDFSFNKEIYSSLSPGERILTVFFWQILRNLSWSEDTPGLNDLPGYKVAPVEDLYSEDGDHTTSSAVVHYPARDYAVARKVDTINGATLNTYVLNVNTAIKQIIDDGTYIAPTPEADITLVKGKGKAVEVENCARNSPTTAAKSDTDRESIPLFDLAIFFPEVHNHVREVAYDESAPLFDLAVFFTQVKKHVKDIASKYLRRGVFTEYDLNPTILLTDTLVCLTENEFAHLPLSVGGNDDQSGGVFSQPVPEAFLGPSGPGPAFHTGHTSASAASTERWETSSVGTTIRVDNGEASYIDRRVVQSDDGLHSESFFTDFEEFGAIPNVETNTLNPVPEEEDDDVIDMSTYDEPFVYETDEESQESEDEGESDAEASTEN